MHNPPMIPRRRLVLVASAAALIGCGGATDDRPAKWSFISATITEPSCATVNCHSEIANRAGVDLHDRASGYRDLVTRGFVLPTSDPQASALVHLLDGRGSIRMPPDAPLPEADVTLIERWIADGAQDN
jgi:hypothetical protein